MIKRGGLPLRGRLTLALLATLALYRCDLFDIFPPEIEIVFPEEDVAYFGSLPCLVKASDNRKVDKVEVSIDGDRAHLFIEEPFVTEISLSGHDGMEATFKVVAYDHAGNWVEAERNIAIIPSSPIVGSYTTPGYYEDVFVLGNYAYIVDQGSGLHIIDVSNPASPTLAGSYNTPGYACGVSVSGGYAYVADGLSGLQVIDVSNPAGPTLAGTYNTPGDAEGVFVSGSYAYVADLGSLQIINVSNPTSPFLAGSYSMLSHARDVFVDSEYAYVARSLNGLVIINISDPANPILAGSYEYINYNGFQQGVEGVYVSGSYAYVADDVNGYLQVINISNPANPILAGSYRAGGSANGVFISGSYAFVVYQTEAFNAGGFKIFSVRNPATPTLINSYNYNSPSSCSGESIFVSDNYAYVVDYYTGLRIFDISGLP